MQMEARAKWDDDADEWTLDGIELAGNRLRVRRPVATNSSALSSLLLMTSMPGARPTSRFAAAKHHYEPDNPRFAVRGSQHTTPARSTCGPSPTTTHVACITRPPAG